MVVISACTSQRDRRHEAPGECNPPWHLVQLARGRSSVDAAVDIFEPCFAVQAVGATLNVLVFPRTYPQNSRPLLGLQAHTMVVTHAAAIRGLDGKRGVRLLATAPLIEYDDDWLDYAITSFWSDTPEAWGDRLAVEDATTPVLCGPSSGIDQVEIDDGTCHRAHNALVYCSALSLGNIGELIASEYLCVKHPEWPLGVQNFSGTCVASVLHGDHSSPALKTFTICRDQEILRARDTQENCRQVGGCIPLEHDLGHLAEGAYSADGGPSLPVAAFIDESNEYLIVDQFRGPNQRRCVALFVSATGGWRNAHCTDGFDMGSY